MTNQDPKIGTMVGQYKITSFITNGGMADVYVGRDEGLQRDAALKILFPQYSRDKVFLARFQREAQAAAQLRHPNVVQVYATGQTPQNEFYIAMEYVPNGTLEDRLRVMNEQNQLLDKRFALSFMREIASALEESHHAGIVHRDLKPSNILMREDNTPVLTDLGIAAVQSASKLTQTDTVLGTPEYMSPEQAEGKEDVAIDGRSDIYSWGIMLYELLTHQRPFTGNSPWMVIHKQIHEDVTPVQQLRPELKRQTVRLIEKCLQKNRDKRYQDVGELLAALDKAIRVEGGASDANTGAWPIVTASRVLKQPPPAPASAGPTGAGAVPPVSTGRSYGMWFIGGGILLLLLLVGFLFVRSGGDGEPDPELIALQATSTALADELGQATAEADVIRSTATASARQTRDVSQSLTAAAPTSTIIPSETPTEGPTATASPTSLASATPSQTPDPALLVTETPTATATTAGIALNLPTHRSSLSAAQPIVRFSWYGRALGDNESLFYGVFIYPEGSNAPIIRELGHKQTTMERNLYSDLPAGRSYQWEVVLYNGTSGDIKFVVSRSFRRSFNWD